MNCRNYLEDLSQVPWTIPWSEEWMARLVLMEASEDCGWLGAETLLGPGLCQSIFINISTLLERIFLSGKYSRQGLFIYCLAVLIKYVLPKLIYHNQTFPTTESFLEAFNNGTLIRHTEQADPHIDLSWARRNRIGTDRDLDHLPGPRSVSFAGVRYKVDRERQYVSWMGWGMYLGFDRDMGLNLWDIRFRGERIIYQVFFLHICIHPLVDLFYCWLACSSRGNCAVWYVEYF